MIRPTAALFLLALAMTTARAKSDDIYRLMKPFQGTWTNKPGVCKTDEGQTAAITTIKGLDITPWETFAWKGKNDESSEPACDAVRGRAASAGSIVVDLRCNHPGHSQDGVSLTRLDGNRMKYESSIWYRCPGKAGVANAREVCAFDGGNVAAGEYGKGFAGYIDGKYEICIVERPGGCFPAEKKGPIIKGSGMTLKITKPGHCKVIENLG